MRLPHLRRDRIVTAAAWGAALLVLAGFAWLLGDLMLHAAGHLSWSFLVDAPRNAGRAGGIGPVLVSTLLLLGVALAVVLPVGVGTAIWLAEYGPRAGAHGGGLHRAVRLCLDTLAGVPSIVFGLFGNAFFCGVLGLGYSIAAGGLTLACMVLPVFVSTAERGLSMVNDDWRTAAAALGMSRASVLWQVLLPAAAPALTAGLMLAMGRAAAETAALIFTSGYADRMPESLADSGRSLAVHVYDLAMNVSGGDAAAYASALVLVALMIVIHLGAQVLSERWLGRRVRVA